MSWLAFLLQIFSQLCFCLKDFTKTIRLLLAAVSINARLTLPMLRLLLSKHHRRKDFWKTSKPCHVSIHLKALTECSQMGNHVPGFTGFLDHFVLAKLSTSSISVKLCISPDDPSATYWQHEAWEVAHHASALVPSNGNLLMRNTCSMLTRCLAFWGVQGLPL